MESLLIAGWFLSVIVAGELSIRNLRHPEKDHSFPLFTIPYMLMGHPLLWLLVGAAGFMNLIQAAGGYGGVDLLLALTCLFTGPTLIAYTAFRLMPSTEMLIWGRRWRP